MTDPALLLHLQSRSMSRESHVGERNRPRERSFKGGILPGGFVIMQRLSSHVLMLEGSRVDTVAAASRDFREVVYSHPDILSQVAPRTLGVDTRFCGWARTVVAFSWTAIYA